MWQKGFDFNQVLEIRTKTLVYFGCGAINKIEDIAKDLKSKNIDKLIVMSGKNAYKSTGAWDYVEKALKSNDIEYINYDRVTPNPTTQSIDEAAAMAKKAEVKEMWLTHYSPSLVRPQDYEEQVRKVFANTIVAKDRRTTTLLFEEG